MSTANIVGCDYSAAKTKPNATWIARGKLVSSTLVVDSLENVGSDLLLESLLTLKKCSSSQPCASETCASETSASEPSALQSSSAGVKDSEPPAWIIGLDFPFSFPAPFAEILLAANASVSSRHSPSSLSSPKSLTAPKSLTSPKSLTAPTWFKLAECVSSLSFPELLALLQSAKPGMGGEVKRLTDNATAPKAQSPLHQINPGMLKMTWQGMQLLLALHNHGFNVLPFATPQCFSPIPQNSETAFRAAVMEVYPAAVLKSLGLPWRRYKGKDQEAKQLRQSILTNLTGTREKLRSVNRIAIAVPELVLPPNVEQFALACDDALDAVVAALGAAIAYLNPGQTAPPRQISIDMIALEGWIYVPYPQNNEATP
ncbi:MAG: DUF429 domain-containing protein [Candidatus Melainabacteria bacterium]|nr:DUF429 domain-containing protein [Candidatus Melainabacteria bacterium]